LRGDRNGLDNIHILVPLFLACNFLLDSGELRQSGFLMCSL